METSESDVTVEQALLDLDNLRCDALLKGDIDTINALLADELTYIHSTNAAVDTKASYLKALQSGDLSYQQIELQNRRVHIYKDTATLTGIMHMRVFSGAENRLVHSRCASVWVKRDQRWQIVLFSSVAMPVAS